MNNSNNIRLYNFIITSKKKTFLISTSILLVLFACQQEKPIDRKALVDRHKVINTGFDTLASLTVGNGNFAFTVDATGLQSFPDLYKNGVSLGTMSNWGWHSVPNTKHLKHEESMKPYDFHGRKINYDVQWKEQGRQRDAAEYFRKNPHRLHLGVIGFEFLKEGEVFADLSEIKNIHQELDLWKGEITSSFDFDGKRVDVKTICDQHEDKVAVSVNSELIKSGQLRIFLKYPYPTLNHTDDGIDWKNQDKHQTELSLNDGEKQASIKHILDTTEYFTSLNWNGISKVEEKGKHYFIVVPDSNTTSFDLTCSFSEDNIEKEELDFALLAQNNQQAWQHFWMSGGAVDFSDCTDARAFELERRVVLSQYLMKVNCSGILPPQETGLTFNSWYGKFHLEMHWWHGVHFALWGRPELLENSLHYYKTIAEQSRKVAKYQGFEGLRWPKMTSMKGINSPSGVGSFLIWQQPHFIYFAELLYRDKPHRDVLDKYSRLVFETASFMASYVQYDSINDRYILGPALIPAQECYPKETTMNPIFELVYWQWALSVAQVWKKRLGEKPVSKWDEIIQKIAKPIIKDDVYLFAESAPDSYTEKYTHDHPIVLGAYGMLNGEKMIDKEIMKNTYTRVMNEWQWPETWGWDFPLTAMAAVRMGEPENAIDALFMTSQTNKYLPNGHNFQNERLRIYLPGNGGLLTSIAMMCAGYDGCTIKNPGFPKDGTWNVKWEGLERMP